MKYGNFKKNRKLKGYRRYCLISLVLVLIILMSSVWSVQAEGGVDRVTSFVNLAKGQALVDVGDLDSFTKEELRFLGVYLSNFYIPFSTELGVTTQEKSEETKNNLITALNKNLKFDKDAASCFVDNIMGLSRTNYKELQFRVGTYNYYSKREETSSSLVSVHNFTLNYFNFLRLMLGYGRDVFIDYVNDDLLEELVLNVVYASTDGNADYGVGTQSDILSRPQDYLTNDAWEGYSDTSKRTFIYVRKDGNEFDISSFASGYGESGFLDCRRALSQSEELVKVPLNYENVLKLKGFSANNGRQAMLLDMCGLLGGESKYCFGFFGYLDKNSNFVPMFDCNINGTDSFSVSSYTASQYAFFQCLYSVSARTAGYGFNAFDLTKEEIDSVGGFKSALGDLSEQFLYKMSSFNSRVSCDCFGNIILSGVNHDIIMVPGCLNPYTWVGVKSDGTDYGYSGQAYNIVSSIGLSLADKGMLLESHTSDSKLITTSSSDFHGGWIGACLSENSFQSQMEGGSDWFGFGRVGDSSIDVNDLFAKCKIRSDSDPNTVIGDSLKIRMLVDGYYTTEDDLSYWAVKYYTLSPAMGYTEFDGGGGLSDIYLKAYNGFINTFLGDTSVFNFSIPGTTDTRWSIGSKNDYVMIGSYKVNDISDTVNIIDKMVFIDATGGYNFEVSDFSLDYKALNFLHYLNRDGTSPEERKLFKDWGNSSFNGWTNMYKDITSGSINVNVEMSDATALSLFTTYAISGLYLDNSKSETIGLLGFRMNRDRMVPIENAPLNLDSYLNLNEVVNTKIKSWLYYILHPTEGLSYVSTLVINKTNSFLLGIHNSIVGTNNVGQVAGSTYYRNNIGYVTTPNLQETSWGNALISTYYSLMPYIILLIVVIMVVSYLFGFVSIQRGLLGGIIFSLFLSIPVPLLNGIVELSNSYSQRVYNEKFIYWALVQQESYSKSLYDAANSENGYSNYIKTQYENNATVYANQGGDSVVVRWQAPKKMASLMLSHSGDNRDNDILNNISNSSLLSSVLSGNASIFSGETYLKGEDEYLYRSYTDIANFSRYVYNGIGSGVRKSSKSIIVSNLNTNVKGRYNTTEMSKAYMSAILNKYSNSSVSGSVNYGSTLRLTIPMSSNMYNDALSVNLSNMVVDKDYSKTDFVGINQDVFNFSIAMFNSKAENYRENLLGNSSSGNKGILSDYLDKYNSSLEEDLTGIAAYSLMSESPFYYFSWGLYDMGMSTSPNAIDGYKNLVLGGENAEFMYSVKNGELKDFMDMRSLFTYIIPYLKAGNDVVREWDSLYGLNIYEGVSTEEGHWDDADIQSSSELRNKYWHNLNVARLYEIYTPWVDLMYDSSYADSEEISYMGKKIIIENPIDPMSYPEDRPMIFSKAEMVDYGLTESMLTKVEKLILQCNDNFATKMVDLLNYSNFSDFSLNTAAAMSCCFEFNNTFSDVSRDVQLYPQSFELEDLSYDAFLRLILANNLSEGINTKEDFYAQIVEKSSLVSAVVLIVLDILAEYIVPSAKILFLMIWLVFSIVVVLVGVLKLNSGRDYYKDVLKSLVLPSVYFLVLTVGFSFIISLFMGNVNKMVTGGNGINISLGSPALTMFMLILLNGVLTFGYYHIVMKMFYGLKNNTSYVKAYFNSMVGKVSGVGFKYSSSDGDSTTKFVNVNEGKTEDRKSSKQLPNKLMSTESTSKFDNDKLQELNSKVSKGTTNISNSGGKSND